jgi:SagB-type dehydrogenase family enzyme
MSTASLPKAVWGRGAPSGGGLYPLEIYWACGPGGPLLPGLYHYDAGQHALERLAVADLTPRVRDALLDHPAAAMTDQFLLVTARFWKNAFKYSNFSYHVITQDVGALMGSWQRLARELGIELEQLLWFADEELNHLLGLRTEEESVLLAVPLPWRSAGPAASAAPAGSGSPAAAGRAPCLVRARYAERSRRVIRFALVEDVHRATLVERAPRPPRPPADRPRPGDPAGIALPPAAPVGAGVVGTLRARRSSFGAFSGERPLSTAELSGALAAASTALPRTDLTAAPSGLTRIAVVANRVDGVTAGCYRYRPGTSGGQLDLTRAGSFGAVLQRNYLLVNYNLEQVGAVLAVVGRPDRAIEAFGARGYRVLNAEVGAVAQGVYLAAAEAGYGCGAVLGLENLAMNELLGLAGTDERTLLFLLIGHERAAVAEFEAPLVRVGGAGRAGSAPPPASASAPAPASASASASAQKVRTR